jgi:hypothetical protein
VLFILILYPEPPIRFVGISKNKVELAPEQVGANGYAGTIFKFTGVAKLPVASDNSIANELPEGKVPEGVKQTPKDLKEGLAHICVKSKLSIVIDCAVALLTILVEKKTKNTKTNLTKKEVILFFIMLFLKLLKSLKSLFFNVLLTYGFLKQKIH